MIKLEFLGTGGAITTPIPGSQSRVSREARAKGVPYSRTGPSIYVHGAEVLIDTPEESKMQIDRAGLGFIPACLYSHWHPDHTLGGRVFETMNVDWNQYPANHRCTDIYLPEQVAEDFKTHLGRWQQMSYLEQVGVVRLHVVADNQPFNLNGVSIMPFRVSEDYVYAFLFQQGETRVLIAMDELFGWQPPDFVHGVDLAVIPMGIPDVHPLEGWRMIPEDHPVLKHEATFEQTLGIVRQLGARRVIMTHIEEPFHMGYDDLLILQERLADLHITFAYDTLMVEV